MLPLFHFPPNAAGALESVERYCIRLVRMRRRGEKRRKKTIDWVGEGHKSEIPKKSPEIRGLLTYCSHRSELKPN